MNKRDILKKLSDKELTEFIWEMRGDLYLLANELERRFKKKEKTDDK